MSILKQKVKGAAKPISVVTAVGRVSPDEGNLIEQRTNGIYVGEPKLRELIKEAIDKYSADGLLKKFTDNGLTINQYNADIVPNADGAYFKGVATNNNGIYGLNNSGSAKTINYTFVSTATSTSGSSKLQAGVGNANGTLPTLCSTGANRTSYKNLAAGTYELVVQNGQSWYISNVYVTANSGTYEIHINSIK